MSLIGVAGHVDHGKSTLVTALTGIDPDRLAEEKARGMTIDLGFAWLTLPSGREVSVVDVPGHEAFIKNMLAGVGSLDVALLVIAADEGVMPQTAEHLAILDLLRVQSGVVALNKADLVEPDWLELVREEVAEVLAPTTLAGAPIIACSAVTGAGLPELLAALDTALDQAPARRDLGRPRLPVDRVFTITGFGVVVTGALADGALALGQEVEALPSGRRARIRGLQAHKRKVERGEPGARLAVNLAGVEKSDLARGDTLTLPGRLRTTRTLDVRLEALPAALRPIAHGSLLDLYLGASEAQARVALLDVPELAPGEAGWAQLRLTRPFVAARGDRFIVRTPSPSETVGGGVVVEPLARRHRRHDPGVLARLELLARGDPAELILAALRGDARAGASTAAPPAPKASRSGAFAGQSEADLIRVTGLPAEEVAAALADLLAREQARRLGALWYAESAWRRLREASDTTLAAYHTRYPLRPGMPREEWRARLGVAPREAAEVTTTLLAEGALAEARVAGAGGAERGGWLRLPAHRAEPTAAQRAQIDALLARYRAAPFAPPTRAEAEEALGPELTQALLDRGELVKVGEGILLEPAALAEATRRVLAHLRAHETITVAQARDLLNTTRKYMLAIFDYLDDQRITERRGDDRTLGREAAAAQARLDTQP
ncbi:MAG TPA: selenocysteine-specific translation elongation factor [Ktedonobacterales bacterium]|nr:selenocysteine-specific translation elongation factor [Ktedonobacterales bacterium]